MLVPKRRSQRQPPDTIVRSSDGSVTAIDLFVNGPPVCLTHSAESPHTPSTTQTLSGYLSSPPHLAGPRGACSYTIMHSKKSAVDSYAGRLFQKRPFQQAAKRRLLFTVLYGYHGCKCFGRGVLLKGHTFQVSQAPETAGGLWVSKTLGHNTSSQPSSLNQRLVAVFGA